MMPSARVSPRGTLGSGSAQIVTLHIALSYVHRESRYYSLMTSQGGTEDLHLRTGGWVDLRPRLVQAQDLSRRIIKLVMIELGGEECRVERHLDLRCEG